jgi:hypothetical protein
MTDPTRNARIAHRALRVGGSRRFLVNLAACLALIARFRVGAVANLRVTIPEHHPGARAGDFFTGVASAIGWAIPNGCVAAPCVAGPCTHRCRAGQRFLGASHETQALHRPRRACPPSYQRHLEPTDDELDRLEEVMFIQKLYLACFGYRRAIENGVPFNEWGFIRPSEYFRATAAVTRTAFGR